MKENNTAKRKTMVELGEIDLSSYWQFLKEKGKNKAIVACYCGGSIISSLNKMNGGYNYFQKACFQVGLKEGDEISVPVRILHFLSWQEAVSMEDWDAEKKSTEYEKLKDLGYSTNLSETSFRQLPIYLRYTLGDVSDEASVGFFPIFQTNNSVCLPEASPLRGRWRTRLRTTASLPSITLRSFPSTRGRRRGPSCTLCTDRSSFGWVGNHPPPPRMKSVQTV